MVKYLAENFQVQVGLLVFFIVLIIGIIFFAIKYRKQIKSAIDFYDSIESIKESQITMMNNQVQLFAEHKNMSFEILAISKETIPNGVNTIRKTNDAIFDIRDYVEIISQKLDARIEIDKSCLFDCDKNGLFISANSALCNLFDTTQDQLMGLGWGKFIHKDDTDVALKNWSRAVKNNQHELNDVFRINTRDGIVIVEYKAIFKYDNDGNLKAIFGTMWKKKGRDRDSENIECIANMAREIKGTKLWDEINKEILNKKNKAA